LEPEVAAARAWHSIVKTRLLKQQAELGLDGLEQNSMMLEPVAVVLQALVTAQGCKTPHRKT
jgi:hypothetical protein